MSIIFKIITGVYQQHLIFTSSEINPVIMRGFLSILLFLCISLSGYSQIFSDILRYSQQRPGGTARVVGVGGSFGAMGGDYGGITINPAALGNYWLSEFTFSPSATITGAESSLRGGAANNISDVKGNLSHIGAVFASSPWNKNWETSSITIGFNRVANFNETFEFNGSTEGSIIGRYLEQANGLSPGELDDFETGPAFETGAIFEPDALNNYGSDFDPFTTVVNKEQNVERSGGISELLFGWGGNYKNKLNLGATLGVPIVRFEESKIYEERDPEDNIEVFDALTFSEFVKTSGVGIKLSVGATYKISKSIRVGAAYHTRSYMALKDSFNTISFYSYTLDGVAEAFDASSPQGVFDYGVQSPARAVGSVGYIFRKGKIAGFVNADVEYTNHAGGSFNLTRDDRSGPADAEYEIEINDLVALELSDAISIRLGSEIAMGKWRFRAGTALNQSPFAADEGNFETSFSLGLGMRKDNFYLDLAGRNIRNSFAYIPYLLDNPEEDQTVEVDLNKTEIIFTAGFVF
jgi:hypothetical protein